jgi:hypothetical protein
VVGRRRSAESSAVHGERGEEWDERFSKWLDTSLACSALVFLFMFSTLCTGNKSDGDWSAQKFFSPPAQLFSSAFRLGTLCGTREQLLKIIFAPFVFRLERTGAGGWEMMCKKGERKIYGVIPLSSPFSTFSSLFVSSN